MSRSSAVSALVVDQAEQWRQGRRLRVEDYVTRRPELRGDADALLTLIIGEVLLRRGAGEAPGREEYQGRFPEVADELAVQWDVLPSADGAPPSHDASTLPDAGATAPPVARAPRIPGYTILSLVGAGGMGVVYKARDDRRGRRLVALKTIRGEVASALSANRFRQEIDSLARVEHPNVVRLYDAGEADGVLYLTMEFVDGVDLAHALDGKPQPPHEAAALVETLARAMAHVHGLGLVHRDLKPGNVLLLASGGRKPPDSLTPESGGLRPPLAGFVPKLTDFGLAKDLDEASSPTTALVGTPSYMAPEQVRRRAADLGPHTDVYALGAILYEMLTGRPPFQGPNHEDVLSQVLFDDPVLPGLLHPKLPRDLETICLGCLDKSLHTRYATADELAGELRRFLEDRPIKRKPPNVFRRTAKFARRRPAVAALIAVVAVAAGAITTLGTVAYVHYELLQKALERLKEAEADLIETTTANAKMQADNEITKEKDAARAYVRGLRGAGEAARRGQMAEFRVLLDSLRPRRGEFDPRTFEWYLEWRRLNRRGGKPPPNNKITIPDKTLPAAPGAPPVRPCLAFSANGKQLAVGQRGGALVYDLNTGGQRLFATPGRTVAALAFSAGGTRLVTAAEDGTVVSWDVPDGKTIGPPAGEPGAPKALALSPDGDRAAVATGGSAVLLWDLKRPAAAPTRLDFGPATVSALAFHPDGLTLAVGGATPRDGGQIGWLKMWDVARNKEAASCDDAPEPVRELSFALRGSSLLCCLGTDGAVWVWNAEKKESFAFLDRTPKTWSPTFAPDGRTLAAALTDTTEQDLVVFYDLTLRVIRPVGIGVARGLRALAFSSDGRWLAGCDDKGDCHLWEAATDDEARAGRP